ncbi:MAG: SRPBCC family protein [Erythrobacter sp.]|uniref:SRPBCC family protein n=1 Tax=Erythrobacter sp. TaxID=1042 RepID=UPI002632A30B|nr:SRPBCC family protein [Erythrobacter sp.]MDJ0978767.1 SRPBCC family protein [Erythrobacter sp.]
MFSFNKKNRLIGGPVEFSADVLIDRPASEVFPLIDINDPRFKDAQMGAHVSRVEGSDDRFELSSDEMEDVVFHFRVLERTLNSRHKVETAIEPRINALVSAIEEHILEPVGESACRVTLTTLATFDDALSDEAIADEVAVMSLAVTSDLEKLKALAEDGIDAARALEDDAIGFDLEFDADFDFGELGIEWDDIEPEQ